MHPTWIWRLWQKIKKISVWAQVAFPPNLSKTVSQTHKLFFDFSAKVSKSMWDAYVAIKWILLT